LQKVEDFQKKGKIFSVFSIFAAISPIALIGGVMSSPSFFSLTYDFIFYVFYAYMILVVVLFFYFKPKIKCEKCNENLTNTYNQNKLEVISCPYCGASFK
jgi:hypothetical protein